MTATATASDADVELVFDAWRCGLAWQHPVVCDVNQRRWLRQLDEIRRSGEGSECWDISRQVGKSYAALGYAVNLGLEIPGAIIRYAAKTKDSAAGILLPNLELLLATCPPELRPWPSSTAGCLEFHNGSRLWWAGTDNQSFDRLRGPRSHLILLDEAAFYDAEDFEKIEAALLPSLQTTGGCVLYLSTPPESPGHPFKARYTAARARGRGQHATIWDNPRRSKAWIERFLRGEAARLGLTYEAFLETTYYRREFLAEFVLEESRAAVPCWDEKMKEARVIARERPKFFDGYVSVDWGGYERDPDAALFCWFDFSRQVLYVEVEFEGRKNELDTLADAWRKIESDLWGVDKFDGTLSGATDWEDIPAWLVGRLHAKAPRQPYLRVGDHDDKLMATLASKYGYAVLPAAKHNKHVEMDLLNTRIRKGNVEIHPRCVRLIEQLSTTVWNKHRTEWERTPKDHGDLVDCLLYAVRSVRWHRDCRPEVKNPDVFEPAKPKSTSLDALKGMLR